MFTKRGSNTSFLATKCIFGSIGINGMGTRNFEGVGDVHPPHLQNFGTFPAKYGRARFFQKKDEERLFFFAAEVEPGRQLQGT